MELIGDYYAEKVLSLEKKRLRKHELLGYCCWNETKLAPNLFGWQIIVEDKHRFDCNTETEARYLRVFLELGWREVFVPKDEKHLAEILPRLEYLKHRADELLDTKLATVFNRKLRAEVRRKVYRMISQRKADISAKVGKAA